MAGFDNRHGHVFFATQRRSTGARMTVESVRYYREMPARELNKGIPVVEEYALHREPEWWARSGR